MILLGSKSDLPGHRGHAAAAGTLRPDHRVEVASAHRQPEKLRRIVRKAEAGGTQVFVAVAGMAAHLPGVVASMTGKPVIGVPVAAGPLAGVDALLSIVQMPPGVPVATVAVGSRRGQERRRAGGADARPERSRRWPPPWTTTARNWPRAAARWPDPLAGRR